MGGEGVSASPTLGFGWPICSAWLRVSWTRQAWPGEQPAAGSLSPRAQTGGAMCPAAGRLYCLVREQFTCCVPSSFQGASKPYPHCPAEAYMDEPPTLDPK